MKEITFKRIEYNQGVFAYAYDEKGQSYDSGEINYHIERGDNVYYIKDHKKVGIKSYEDIRYEY